MSFETGASVDEMDVGQGPRPSGQGMSRPGRRPRAGDGGEKSWIVVDKDG
jgi:hypothetical protein